jgi:Domain of unknown function (DUF4158)
MVEPVVGMDDQRALTPDDHALVMNKHRANRLGFAILLAFFRDRGRFPRDESEIEPEGIAALSRQLNVAFPVDGKAFLTGRTAERLRAEIRARFGFRESYDLGCGNANRMVTQPRGWRNRRRNRVDDRAAGNTVPRAGDRTADRRPHGAHRGPESSWLRKHTVRTP